MWITHPGVVSQDGSPAPRLRIHWFREMAPLTTNYSHLVVPPTDNDTATTDTTTGNTTNTNNTVTVTNTAATVTGPTELESPSPKVPKGPVKLENTIFHKGLRPPYIPTSPTAKLSTTATTAAKVTNTAISTKTGSATSIPNPILPKLSDSVSTITDSRFLTVAFPRTVHPRIPSTHPWRGEPQTLAGSSPQDVPQFERLSDTGSVHGPGGASLGEEGQRVRDRVDPRGDFLVEFKNEDPTNTKYYYSTIYQWNNLLVCLIC